MHIMTDSPIRFPGLFGDWAFTASGVAFHIGGKAIYWYGIIIALGVVLAGCVHMEHLDVWGSKTLLGQAGPGDLFAETYACQPEAPLLVSAVAAEGGEACCAGKRASRWAR